MDRERVDGVRVESDGDASGFEDEVRRIVEELQTLTSGASVHVRETPDALKDLWPNARHKSIRILNSARVHYLSHSWVADNEDQIVRTLLDPDFIRQDAKKPEDKVVSYRAVDNERHVLVVVEQKPVGSLSNRIVTAFDALPMEVERRRHLEALVWKR